MSFDFQSADRGMFRRTLGACYSGGGDEERCRGEVKVVASRRELEMGRFVRRLRTRHGGPR